MKIQYIADDGTVFSNQPECEEYENSLHENSIVGLRSDYQSIDYSNYYFPLNVSYFFIENAEAGRSIRHRLERVHLSSEGINCVPEYYYWDEEVNLWRPIDDRINELDKEKEALTKALSILQKERENK